MWSKCCMLVLFLHIITEVPGANGARILGMFPLNGKSHFAMFEVVMKSLADRGHRVDVLSTFPLKKPYPNYTDLSIGEWVPVIVNNMNYDLVLEISGSSEKAFIELTGNDVCDNLKLPPLQKLINNPPDDPPYDLVIVELFYANCYLAFGRHLNVPVVGLTSSPLLPYTNEPIGNPLNTAYVPEIEDGSVSHMKFWQRLKNTIVTWMKILQSRYFTESQDEAVRKYFHLDMPGIRQLERELALLLVNSHYSVNGIRPMTPAVVEVGGLHVKNDSTELPKELKKWLDESEKGCIYVSFGSMVTIESFPEKTLLEIYTAFKKIAPIRVLMKVANAKSLPPGLPSNVLTSNWVPQVQVLRHMNIKAFVTHGGLMGVQEAVTYGVPLIGVPLFRDQPVNIKNCADKGAAIMLDHTDLTADKIVASVNAVAHDPSYKQNMMMLSERFLDRPMNARETTIYWIEYILKHGGDALRSPAVKLTWWQVTLLDVYGSVLAALFVLFYTAKLILSAICRRFLYRNRTTPPTKKRN
ncbi:UDP-glucosyltransferase 2-like [Diprion similis]|uniref:UDP-glucosyltransferase 2-like n=1 Tax=Diprion similis TaxID=362088 RepID=UPI001EF96523|nr:UDP-glucosyltransferase 2-like [Diprion similis]